VSCRSAIGVAIALAFTIVGASFAQAQPSHTQTKPVTICSLYGEDYFYAPSLGTCVKIGAGLAVGWATGSTSWRPLFGDESTDRFNLNGGMAGGFLSGRIASPSTKMFIGLEGGYNYLALSGNLVTIGGDVETTRLKSLLYVDVQVGIVTPYGSPYLLAGIGTGRSTSSVWGTAVSQNVTGGLFGAGFDFPAWNRWSFGLQGQVFLPTANTSEDLGYSIKSQSETFMLKVQRNFLP
jgi:hypothetical protein